jgi:hypothetical protein
MRSGGVIRRLGRYPVKSMRGKCLPATTLTLQGVPADRRYATYGFARTCLIDQEGGEAFDELNWVGRILRVGDAARIAITQVDQRGMMIAPALGQSGSCHARPMYERSITAREYTVRNRNTTDDD